MKKYLIVLLLDCLQANAQVIDVTKFGVNPNDFVEDQAEFLGGWKLSIDF